jgi:hypothetical protein
LVLAALLALMMVLLLVFLPLLLLVEVPAGEMERPVIKMGLTADQVVEAHLILLVVELEILLPPLLMVVTAHQHLLGKEMMGVQALAATEQEEAVAHQQ